MRIALISDTHSFIDPLLEEHIADADELWHAGDIGDISLYDHFKRQSKRFRAVFGNIDSNEVRLATEEYLFFKLEGLKILIIHIANRPPSYTPRLRAILEKCGNPDLLICGHSHILRVERDAKRDNMLCINPGAVGNHGFHKIKTLIKFDLNEGAISNLKAIELGSRAKVKK